VEEAFAFVFFWMQLMFCGGGPAGAGTDKWLIDETAEWANLFIFCEGIDKGTDSFRALIDIPPKGAEEVMAACSSFKFMFDISRSMLFSIERLSQLFPPFVSFIF
jgi:hypothetical protein